MFPELDECECDEYEDSDAQGTRGSSLPCFIRIHIHDFLRLRLGLQTGQHRRNDRPSRGRYEAVGYGIEGGYKSQGSRLGEGGGGEGCEEGGGGLSVFEGDEGECEDDD